jgi:hypothetical protein
MSNSLVINFDNSTTIDDKEVYLYVQATAANCDISYAGGNISFGDHNQLSNPITLHDIKTGGLTINKLISGVIFIAYGNKFPTIATPPKTDTSMVPYATVELTRNNPPVAGDAGDLTAINYFTAAMSVNTYDQNKEALQSKAYSKSTKDILNLLYELEPNATVFNSDDTPKTPVRVISAYTYATEKKKNPYPSFDSYLTAVNKAGQITTIDNNGSNAWNHPAPNDKGYTNYAFGFNFTARVVKVNGANSIVLSDGSIEVTSIDYKNNKAIKTTTKTIAKNLTVTIDGSNIEALNQAIYGQNINDAVSFTDNGSEGWNALQQYLNKYLSGQNVYDTIQNLIIGEITSGFLFGFINSAEIPNGGTTAIKDMPSYKWWNLSPNDGYAKAQPTKSYYDTYAGVINECSGNQVYGAAYGDRFTNPKENPTFETSFYKNQAVCSITINLDPPISMYPIQEKQHNFMGAV